MVSQDDTHFAEPIVVATPEGPLLIASVRELIQFIHQHGNRWPELREASFVAAAFPTPQALADLRKVAIAAFRASEINMDKRRLRASAVRDEGPDHAIGLWAQLAILEQGTLGVVRCLHYLTVGDSVRWPKKNAARHSPPLSRRKGRG